MEFKLLRFKNQTIETKDLKDDLLSVSKQLNKSPTISEYNLYGKYESSVYIRRFSSWNKALETIGLNFNNKEWSESELLQNIETVWIKLGKQPARRDMHGEFSKISSGAYLRRYQTWTNALSSFVQYMNSTNSDPADKNVDTHAHKTKRRDFNLRERWLIMKRDGFKCCKCGRSPATTPGLELHVDHEKAWANGGETTIENGRTLCQDCNWGKSDLE